jgi:hypothetical protein
MKHRRLGWCITANAPFQAINGLFPSGFVQGPHFELYLVHYGPLLIKPNTSGCGGVGA